MAQNDLNLKCQIFFNVIDKIRLKIAQTQDKLLHESAITGY